MILGKLEKEIKLYIREVDTWEFDQPIQKFSVITNISKGKEICIAFIDGSMFFLKT